MPTAEHEAIRSSSVCSHTVVPGTPHHDSRHFGASSQLTHSVELHPRHSAGVRAGFGLRSASGKVERRRRAASSDSQPERNAAAEPQTEARRYCSRFARAAHDERAICEASRLGREGERATGRP